MDTDPLTGAPLPATAIQRILFLAPKVHIYQIPPLTSTKGYQASTWTADNNKRLIFTARLRILETSIPNPNFTTSDEPEEKVSTTLLLEDPSTGALFAAAPYTNPNIVEQALDSSRFFAITVVGEGRKAVLGLGFEERSEAFDFSISLQDARRVMGMEIAPNAATGPGRKAPTTAEPQSNIKRDFSLKEGETISINFGGKGRRAREESGEGNQKSDQDALFSIKPPPGSGVGIGSLGGEGGMPFLPPPPSAKSVKEERRRSRQTFEQTPQDLGFDDGEFGEFQ
ncbi:adaptin ear-binding coat-associated protein-like protein 1 [Amniculicola lignicola CBS 123094]|uniref:Adaptin ear-binding coat-associated protein-like protein 1 n=1 Tax=Amniculicola lignicola CBS 123094 TaxID=1392246 RepID=A0A6A5VXI6_9PLEO|nr:adaptin ear-binding coat-associated protein-like protein 1 [Amniculicola lignicola CBS 123094]